MAPATGPCAHCGKKATVVCDHCKNAGYCSKLCRETDESVHENLCDAFVTLVPRPSPAHVRAILLPDNSSMPNFVWLPTEFEDGGSESGDDTVGDKAHGEEGESNEHHDVKGQREQASVDDGDEWEDELDEDEEDEEEDEDEDDDDDDVEMDYAAGVPLFDKAKGSVLLARAGYSPLLGDCGYKSELKELVCGKRGGGNLLDHSIYLRTRESFLSDGSGPNPVLLALGKTEAANCFRGPLLLFGMTKVCDPRFCRDLNAGDFTLAIRALDRANKMSKDPLGTMADALRNLILRR